MAYAWEVSGGDKDFVLTLNAENGAWTEDRVHDGKNFLCWDHASWDKRTAPDQRTNAWKCREKQEGWFWKAHKDHGICGINDGYKKKIKESPNFSDWKWQVQKCLELYRGGTRFYGYDVRYKRGKSIVFPK